jgi:hypothetical protein
MPVGDVMDPLLEPHSTDGLFPVTRQDWKHTPPAVHAALNRLRDETDSSKNARRVEKPGCIRIPPLSAADGIGFS